LAQRFLARYCAAQGLPLDSKVFSREALDVLVGYQWPGNIRELESTVSRAALSAPARAIRPTDIEFLHAQVPSVQHSGERLPSLRGFMSRPFVWPGCWSRASLRRAPSTIPGCS